jgi:signal transduction histidine kinase
MEEGSPSAQSALDPANHAPIQARLRRKRVQTELGSLFAEVSQLVGDAHAPQNAKMVEALRSIRDTLRTSTEPAKERIASLLGQEEPLPPAPPGTRPKRKKPKAPKFSHAEYMSRFAELTQEIAQPLTVTNSVIEVLRQGQIGSLNETQTQFLDLALESVDRVNQLIKYMHTLFGEPESFTPDAAIIQETYV